MLEVFSWMMTGLGLGLVASFVHSVTGQSADDDGLVAYREARSLIKELLALSRDLSSGLDADESRRARSSPRSETGCRRPPSASTCRSTTG